jgi:hypothetical protein
MSKYKRIYLRYKTNYGNIIWYVARSKSSLKRYINSRKIKNENIICITNKRPSSYDNHSLEDVLRNIDAYDYYLNKGDI